jgi:5-methylcytosine-specific restriction endonuclease McrA
VTWKKSQVQILLCPLIPLHRYDIMYVGNWKIYCCLHGRLFQRENISFTRRRSGVRIPHRLFNKTQTKGSTMTRVLQIDSGWKPVGMVTWQRAMNLIYQDGATIIEADPERFIGTPKKDYPMPLVIQLPEWVELRPLKDNVIIRRVLYARDGWRCKYCNKRITMRTGTIDHVKPKIYFIREGRSVSDANTWDNVVTACAPCNHRKGGRLPRECGMMPSGMSPRKPNYVQTMWAGRSYHPIQAKYVAMYFRCDVDELMQNTV